MRVDIGVTLPHNVNQTQRATEGALVAGGYEHVDAALMGNLPARLTEWRAQGLSHEEIADRLAADGFRVSGETARRWCKRAGLPGGRARAVGS